MKNIIIGVFFLTVLALGSCKKNTVSPSGSWTLKGRTFTTATCTNVSGMLTAATTPSDSAAIFFSFGNGSMLPASSGSYRVASGLSGDSSLVFISLTIGSFVSYSSSNSGTVAVTVSGGKVNVSGSNIMMKNDNVASDSSGLTFNITQLQ